MDDELIRVCAVATRVACQRMTPPDLKALRDSVEQACCLPAMTAWDRKGHGTRGDRQPAGRRGPDPTLALLVRNVPGELYDLMITVGPGAGGIVASSRRRLLALITAGDAGGRRVRWSSTSRACAGCGAWPAAPSRATSRSERLAGKQSPDRPSAPSDSGIPASR